MPIDWKYVMIHPETGQEHELLSNEWQAVLSCAAYGDMILAAQECPVEVGGKHRVLIDRERRRFFVPQIWIPAQVCAGGCFELHGEAEFAAMTEAEAQGLSWSEFRLGHWHSHGSGPAVLSGVDLRSTEDHMFLFHNDWVHSDYPWRDHEIQIEFVVNRHGHISARFSSAVPAIVSVPLSVRLQDGITREALADYAAAHRARIHVLVYEKVRVIIDRDKPPISIPEFLEYQLRKKGGDE